jgi:hypothetical protein
MIPGLGRPFRPLVAPGLWALIAALGAFIAGAVFSRWQRTIELVLVHLPRRRRNDRRRLMASSVMASTISVPSIHFAEPLAARTHPEVRS